MRINWLLLLVLGLTISSCSKQQRTNLDLNTKPTSLGNVYQVLVVTEANLLKTSLYDTIDYNLAPPYTVVPNMEDALDLDYINPLDFVGYMKHRRHIVFIGTLDGDNRTSRIIQESLGKENIIKARENSGFRYAMRKDVWAKGQHVFYLFAPTSEGLPSAIHKASPKIIKEIYKSELEISKASAYAGGLNNSAMIEVERKLGISIEVPKGYRLASNEVLEDDAVWIRHDAQEIGYNILIQVMDYSNETELKTDNLIKIRNKLGKKYVTSNIEGAHMTTELDNRPFPMFTSTSINGNYALEGRGLWKMVDDYMGGPFLSYMVYNPNTNKVVYMDAFLQAPAKKAHRNYVQRLQTIMQTLNF